MTYSLISLSIDSIRLIYSFLHDYSDVWKFSSTCKRVRQLLDPKLISYGIHSKIQQSPSRVKILTKLISCGATRYFRIDQYYEWSFIGDDFGAIQADDHFINQIPRDISKNNLRTIALLCGNLEQFTLAGGHAKLRLPKLKIASLITKEMALCLIDSKITSRFGLYHYNFTSDRRFSDALYNLINKNSNREMFDSNPERVKSLYLLMIALNIYDPKKVVSFQGTNTNLFDAINAGRKGLIYIGEKYIGGYIYGLAFGKHYTQMFDKSSHFDKLPAEETHKILRMTLRCGDVQTANRFLRIAYKGKHKILPFRVFSKVLRTMDLALINSCLTFGKMELRRTYYLFEPEIRNLQQDQSDVWDKPFTKEVVKLLLSHTGSISTLASYAAAAGDWKTISYLMKVRPDVRWDVYGATPCNLRMMIQHPEVFRPWESRLFFTRFISSTLVAGDTLSLKFILDKVGREYDDVIAALLRSNNYLTCPDVVNILSSHINLQKKQGRNET